MGAPYGNCNAGTGKTCSPGGSGGSKMPSPGQVNRANKNYFGPKAAAASKIEKHGLSEKQRMSMLPKKDQEVVKKIQNLMRKEKAKAKEPRYQRGGAFDKPLKLR